MEGGHSARIPQTPHAPTRPRSHVCTRGRDADGAAGSAAMPTGLLAQPFTLPRPAVLRRSPTSPGLGADKERAVDALEVKVKEVRSSAAPVLCWPYHQPCLPPCCCGGTAGGVRKSRTPAVRPTFPLPVLQLLHTPLWRRQLEVSRRPSIGAPLSLLQLDRASDEMMGGIAHELEGARQLYQASHGRRCRLRTFSTCAAAGGGWEERRRRGQASWGQLTGTRAGGGAASGAS